MTRTPRSNGYRKYAIGGAAIALVVAVIAVAASWPRQTAVSPEGRAVLAAMRQAADGIEQGSDRQYIVAADMLDAYRQGRNAEACPLFVSALEYADAFLQIARNHLSPAIPEMAATSRARLSEAVADARQRLDEAEGQLE